LRDKKPEILQDDDLLHHQVNQTDSSEVNVNDLKERTDVKDESGSQMNEEKQTKGSIGHEPTIKTSADIRKTLDSFFDD
jgi:hypothetical protein